MAKFLVIDVGFVVGEVPVVQFFYPNSLVFPCLSHFTTAPYSYFMLVPLTLYNLGS